MCTQVGVPGLERVHPWVHDFILIWSECIGVIRSKKAPRSRAYLILLEFCGVHRKLLDVLDLLIE